MICLHFLRKEILFMKCNHKQMKSKIYEIIKEIYE